MLISCISENKIKGRTSIFYRKTEKGKPIRDADQNYASKHYLLCHLYQCFQFFHIFTCLHYRVPLNFTSSENNKKTKKITHTNKETNEREAKIMIMEVIFFALRTLRYRTVFSTQLQLISRNIFEKEKLNIILNLIKIVKALCDGPKL